MASSKLELTDLQMTNIDCGGRECHNNSHSKMMVSIDKKNVIVHEANK